MSANPGRASSPSQILRAAAAARPDAIFARIGADVADAANALRVGALDALADHYAARWRETRPPAGTRALLLGAPEPRALASIIGALRAGLEVALAPPSLDAAAIAAAVDRLGASALAGPSELAGLPIAERLFEAAARHEAVRLVALHGGGVSGALWLDAPLEEDGPTPAATQADFVDILDAGLEFMPLSLNRAIEVARAYAERAGLRPGDAIVSLVSLGAPAGLIVGALAPLIGGAHMIWQSPFSARRLVETLESSAPTHLVAPIGVVGELGAAGLLVHGRLASLTLVAPDDAPPPAFTHGLDPDQVLVLRVGLPEGPRLGGFEEPESETASANFG